MRQELLAIIPEFDLIHATDLREQTLQTWELALRESGWTVAGLKQMPFTLLINPCPANFIEHVRAVTLTALRAADVFAEVYGARTPLNRDYLIAGGLLHDIGKLLEYTLRADGVTVQTEAGQLLRHPFSGMELAARCGLPLAVQHIIATHAAEGDRGMRTTEALLVHHADFMSFHSFLGMAQKKESSARLAPSAA